MTGIQEVVQVASVLSRRNPAFEKAVRAKVDSMLLAMKLGAAREIFAAGAEGYFSALIARLSRPALLKVAKKFDAHLSGRDAMPEAWLRAHVMKLLANEAEPAKKVAPTRTPRIAADAKKRQPAPGSTRKRAKPESVRVVVR